MSKHLAYNRVISVDTIRQTLPIKSDKSSEANLLTATHSIALASHCKKKESRRQIPRYTAESAVAGSSNAFCEKSHAEIRISAYTVRLEGGRLSSVSVKNRKLPIPNMHLYFPFCPSLSLSFSPEPAAACCSPTTHPLSGPLISAETRCGWLGIPIYVYVRLCRSRLAYSSLGGKRESGARVPTSGASVHL